MEGEYFNDIILEEAGQFPLVNEARESIVPALKDGEDFVGTIYCFWDRRQYAEVIQAVQGYVASADTLGLVNFLFGGPDIISLMSEEKKAM